MRLSVLPSNCVEQTIIIRFYYFFFFLSRTLNLWRPFLISLSAKFRNDSLRFRVFPNDFSVSCFFLHKSSRFAYTCKSGNCQAHSHTHTHKTNRKRARCRLVTELACNSVLFLALSLSRGLHSHSKVTFRGVVELTYVVPVALSASQVATSSA